MNETSSPVRLLVVTGISGAGRRSASHTLEDMGWLVVDNLPPSLLPDLMDVSRERQFTRVAVLLDVRSRSEFQQIPKAFATLGESGVVPQILFLDASDEVIIRRQESVRRPLPLQGTGRLLDGIQLERKMLEGLRASADLVIDTTDLNVHELAARVTVAFAGPDEAELRLTLMSFGFKNGIPIDADMVLDVRFLPNPHWVPALRPQSGLSQPVANYVLGQEDAEPFLDHVLGLLTLIRPGYVREGKRHATVAIGCTGGKHRSTAIVEEIARRLGVDGVPAEVVHRDLGRE
ncbi:MAG TPA: RNase adapter RapZ [Propionicimonas sp.]|nr:RNase adapter RapZ [Propionicimonas sp.]HRA06129.1 RNase adapter RapZ [Propionicimonas sp.]